MKKVLLVLGVLAFLSGVGAAAGALGYVTFGTRTYSSNPCGSHQCVYPHTDGYPHAVSASGAELGALGASNALPSQTSNSGKFLTTNGTAASWAENLPSQTSNSGKFLTTNGTAASWADTLPSQSGNSGKVLTTNGTTTSWADPTFTLFSPVTAYQNCRDSSGNISVPAIGSSAEKDAVWFSFTKASTVTGGRFYWPGAAAATVRLLLYNAHNGSLLKNVDVSVNGAGTYTGTFASSQSAGIEFHMYLAIHQTSNNQNMQTCTQGANNQWPGSGTSSSMWGSVLLGRGFTFCTSTCANTDSTAPSSSTGNIFGIEPIYTTP